MTKKRGIRVGITVSPASDVPSVMWSNGMFQNVVYLALMFKAMDGIEPFLVSYPFDGKPHPVGTCFDLAVISTAEEAAKLDVIVELGIQLEADFTGAFRDHGGKLVSYMAGNAMVMNFEHVFLPATDVRGSMLRPTGFDAVWITPQHMHMNAASMALVRGPTFEAPHIWAPVCIEHAQRSLGLNAAWKGRPETWSLGCFDPNINVVKSFHIPLLATEAAYRQNPEAIRRLMLFCTQHLQGRPHFESYVGNLTLPTSKITSEGRHGIVSMLGKEVDMVLHHQWENDLNYMYWDTLYLGYPLIHNSKRIQEAGYYFKDFDPADGGEAILAAMDMHDGPTEADKQAVWRHHIGNPANQEKYRDLLKKVLDGEKAA